MSVQTEEYNTISGAYEGEITEKRSRFIAYAVHIENEEEALRIIEAKKKEYWDARHNCYAYILGDDGGLLRFSDDGEPSGTAGKPILEVIRSKGLTYTLVIVTRYFGGVLLGTGGLVRAYTDATIKALEVAAQNGGMLCMCLMQELDIVTDYTMSGKVQYTLAESEAVVTDTSYFESVRFKVAVPLRRTDMIIDKITNVTSGKAVIGKGQVTFVSIPR